MNEFAASMATLLPMLNAITKDAEDRPVRRTHYAPVSKTDEACIHCRSGFMGHHNGMCPIDDDRS